MTWNLTDSWARQSGMYPAGSEVVIQARPRGRAVSIMITHIVEIKI